MKFPRAGEVNTRMIPDIGAEKAAMVHQRMAEHTIEKVNDFAQAQTTVYIANCTDAEASEWLGGTEYRFQEGSGLGERMANAVERSMKKNIEKVLIVGTDCPDLGAEVFEQALSALDGSDVVYVPAHDGGYVLIGMSKLHHVAFQNIDWGSAEVLSQSLKQLDAHKISYKLLDEKYDVDFAKDIPKRYLK